MCFYNFQERWCGPRPVESTLAILLPPGEAAGLAIVYVLMHMLVYPVRLIEVADHFC